MNAQPLWPQTGNIPVGTERKRICCAADLLRDTFFAVQRFHREILSLLQGVFAER